MIRSARAGRSTASEIDLSPAAMLARVLYRDALVLVIDKPAGVPVHAGPGRGPNLEMYLDALRFGLPQAPALAHRLDRDTSGCLVLGRHRRALARVGRLFAAGFVGKTYWAVLEGVPAEPDGVVALPLRKRTHDKRRWHMMVHPEGQSAITEYRVRGRSGGRSWVEFSPKTGRTHQVRVHAAALGCPVVGDPVYGPGAEPVKQAPSEPLMLHARAVVLPLYEKREPIRVEAPVPAHMRATLKACGFEP